MLKQLKAISELEHEKELVVYKIKNGYRICEDHGELVATAKPKKFVDIMAPIDELGIRNLKETLRRKNSILKKPSEVEVNKNECKSVIRLRKYNKKLLLIISELLYVVS